MALETRANQARYRSMSLGGGGHAEVWLEPGSQVALHTTSESSRGGGSGGGYWTKCKNPGCLGSVIGCDDLCYAHAPGGERDFHLREVTSGQKSLDLRGNEIDPQLWASACEQLSDNGVVTAPINCSAAVFTAKIRMQGVKFRQHLAWSAAIFEDGSEVNECSFDGGLDISFTQFRHGPGYFPNCRISNLEARFSHTGQHIAFVSCEINGEVNAQGAQKDSRIEECVIHRLCNLSQVDAEILFINNTQFRSELNLSYANVKFFRASGAELAVPSVLGPITTETADLSNAHFKRRVRLLVSASNLNMAASSFDGGGRIECERAAVDLSGMVVAGPLLIIGSRGASILSIQDADCGHLTLSSLDLSGCRFYGCHDLQDIGLESTVSLSHAPRPLRSKRRCIADEFALRASRKCWRARDWAEAPEARENLLQERQSASALSPAQVAGVYRSLRKSVEAQSDEPGACDFYYGEMEMRRLDRTKSPWEQALVWLYWLVSGYGLRGFRSLFWLLCLLFGGSVLMQKFGVKGQHSWGSSVVATAQSMVPGLSVHPPLTNNGEAFEIALRILGPILLALAALALRNRVRR